MAYGLKAICKYRVKHNNSMDNPRDVVLASKYYDYHNTNNALAAKALLTAYRNNNDDVYYEVVYLHWKAYASVILRTQLGRVYLPDMGSSLCTAHVMRDKPEEGSSITEFIYPVLRELASRQVCKRNGLVLNYYPGTKQLRSDCIDKMSDYPLDFESSKLLDNQLAWLIENNILISK